MVLFVLPPVGPGTGRWSAGCTDGALGPLAEPLVHLVRQDSQVIEGGGAVSHEEVLNFLGETAPVSTAEGHVIPSAICGQSAELKGVVSDASSPLLNRVESPRRISSGCGVVEYSTDLAQEKLEVGG